MAVWRTVHLAETNQHCVNMVSVRVGTSQVCIEMVSSPGRNLTSLCADSIVYFQQKI